MNVWNETTRYTRRQTELKFGIILLFLKYTYPYFCINLKYTKRKVSV